MKGFGRITIRHCDYAFHSCFFVVWLVLDPVGFLMRDTMINRRLCQEHDLWQVGNQLGKAYSSNNMGDGPPMSAATKVRGLTLKQKQKKFRAVSVLRSPSKKPTREVEKTYNVHAIVGLRLRDDKFFEINAEWECLDGTGVEGVKEDWTNATDLFHLHTFLCDYLEHQHDVPALTRTWLPKADIVKIAIDRDPMIQKVTVFFKGISKGYNAFYVCVYRPALIVDFFKTKPTQSGDDIKGHCFEIVEVFQQPSSPAVESQTSPEISEDELSLDRDDDERDDEVLSNPSSHDLEVSPALVRNGVSVEEVVLHGAEVVFSNPPAHNHEEVWERAEVPLSKPLPPCKVFSPLMTLPVSEDDIQAALVPILATLYVKSRALQKLKPFTKWHSDQKETWRKILTKHLLWLDKELNSWDESKDDLHLLNIVLTHLALPVDGLLPCTFIKARHDTVKLSVANSDFKLLIPESVDYTRHHPPTQQVDRSQAWRSYTMEEQVVKKTIKTVLNGEQAKARKIWSSFGTAPKCQKVADVTVSMHPNHGKGVSARDTTTPPSSNFSSALCERRITNEARGVGSIDATGWSSDYWACVINLLSSERVSYVKILARFVGVLTKHPTIPCAVAFAVGTGALTMLNKIPEAENLCLLERGDTPKVRPVNNGTDLSKKIGRATIDSNNGKVVNRRLTDQFQGRSKGCQKVGLILQAAYKNGKVITKNDKKNAFNDFSREGILQGVKKLWPAGYPVVYTYYGLIKSPIFFMYRDVNNELCLLVNYSVEGVKQGCSFGSFCYAMGAEYNIFSHLRKAYPEVDICAITDDQVDIWDAPGPEGTQEDWDFLYVKIAGFKKLAKELAMNVNLCDAPDKECILIPEYGFFPSQQIIDGVKLNVTKEGLVNGGFPIGKTSFQECFAEKKSDLNLGRLGLATKFEDLHTQYLLATTTRCINRSMDFLAGGIPTNIIAPILRSFDFAIQAAVLKMLRTPVELIAPHKLLLSTSLLGLPTSSQGAGLVPVTRKAPALFLDSVMEVSKEKLFKKNSMTLLPDVSAVYTMMLGLFGISSISCDHPLASVLPCSSLNLLQLASTRSAKATLPTLGKVKLLMKFLHDELRIKLLQEVLVAPNPSDRIHFLTILTSSIYHKFLNVDLREKFFHMDSDSFRFSMSFFLGLPFPRGPHYNGSSFHPELGYYASKCASHGVTIDANGDHFSSCTKCYGTRQALHKSLITSCIHFLNKAEFTTSFEPSLTKILGPLDSHTERLFSKRVSKVGTTNIAKARAAMEQATDKSREGQIAALRELLASLPDVPHSEVGAIRPDFLAVPNDGKGSSYCGDFTSIHTSAASYRNESLRDLAAVAKIDIEMSGMSFSGALSRFDRSDQGAVAGAVQRKKDKYQLISDLANLRSKVSRKHQVLQFIPAVVTHNGQLNYELFSFIENCTTRFKRIDKDRFDINGLDARQRVSNFRVGFKNSLIFSLASNWGNQLRCGVVSGCVS
jgi:hypothetical protein